MALPMHAYIHPSEDIMCTIYTPLIMSLSDSQTPKSVLATPLHPMGNTIKC